MMSSAPVSVSLSSPGSRIPEPIRSPVQADLWTWQQMQPNSGPGSTFHKFCDALEVKDGVSAPASGWGLEHGLAAWSNYYKTVTLPRSKLLPGGHFLAFTDRSPLLFWSLGCPDSDIENCLGTYNPDNAFWSDTKVDK